MYFYRHTFMKFFNKFRFISYDHYLFCNAYQNFFSQKCTSAALYHVAFCIYLIGSVKNQINVIDLQTGTIETFLDISSGFNLRAGGEQGLLGMAFDPDYNSAGSSGQGKFYLNFTVNGGIWRSENGCTSRRQTPITPTDFSSRTIGTRRQLR